ncbi:hypothetical protein P9Z55_24250 [Bacillus thuringiensis]|nr:hypothetical protein [Bacillus thuringiensis]MEC2804781.1 hypothetical protein [Bacillus thuringiensis]
MFWLGGFLGYIVGSITTCAILYFGYRAEKKEGRKINKKGV